MRDEFEPIGLGLTIFRDRYARSPEESWQEACRRVADHVAAAEENGKVKRYSDRFNDQIASGRFFPGGRIMYGAGRPKAQLLNCLSGDTLVHTVEGLIPARELIDREIGVLSEGGIYRLAKWYSYGQQELYTVRFVNGDEVEVTGQHEWVVTRPKGGIERVVTTNLESRHVPVQHRALFTYDEESWKEGVQHGLTWGDGSLYMGGRYATLLQFGDSKHLIEDYFDSWSEYNRDNLAVTKLPATWKTSLPSDESDSYKRGFIAGLIGADGCVDSRGHVMLHSSRFGELVEIRKIASSAGLPSTSIKMVRTHNPWTGDEAPLWKLSFVKAGFFQNGLFDSHLVLKNKHRDYMVNTVVPAKQQTMKVESVKSTGRIEDVYCCIEPDTHTMVIGPGYLTGQCFVVPTGDSREAWGKTANDTIIISGLMGGVGMNLSPIRGRDYAIKGTGGLATGAVSYGQLIDGIGDVIRGGGGRRMALMLALNLNHPDVEEFLKVKLDLDQLNNANISIIIPNDISTERFQEMVCNDEQIPLEFNGRPDEFERTVSAKWLWDKLVENSYRSGEPGILNGHLANKMNNIWYHKPLISTNPCVTGDTWVMTESGPRRVNELLDAESTSLVVNGESTPATGFFYTGTKKVYTLSTFEGYNLNLTADHQILLDDGTWIEAQSLREGDKIVLHNHNSLESWSGEGGTWGEGYVVGHFIGDGTWAHRPRLCSWGESGGEQLVRDYLAQITEQEWRRTAQNYVLHTDIPEMYLDTKTKGISDEIQKASSLFQRGFLKGLFDTDGHVEGSSTAGGISIRLSQSNLDRLHDVQRMLLHFGIRSKINLAREAGRRSMPDGKSGLQEYDYQTQWRLIITSDCDRFMQKIGFLNTDKRLKFEELRAKMSRGFYEKAFVATFSSLEFVGDEDVFDVQVPNHNAFDANGLYVHNCGEIWLEAYGCCDLGALVLPRFVVDGQFNWDAFDESIRLGVRFLDNVLTVNHYPLPEIKENCENVRRIGLGVMGLHTMLLEMGMRYDDPESFAFVDKLFETLKNTSYDASINLAIEKGAFPAYDDRFLESGFTKTLKRGIRNKIREHGIRNCAMLTIAPTGTTSMVAGVSSGIEPIPSPIYWRNYYKPSGDLTRELVVEEAFEKYDHSILQSAIDVPVRSHFEMQKIVQYHIDNAVSKTINMAVNTSIEEFSDIWLEYLAYCKGTTVYRFGSRQNEPINPVPREQWEEIVGQAHVGEMTVDEFMALDCVGGVCDVPQQWQSPKVAEQTVS